MKSQKIYSLSFPSKDKDYERFGVAYADAGQPDHILFNNGKASETANVIEFELQDGEFADYQANNLGVRLFSQRLKEAIEGGKAQLDALEWREAVVRSGDVSRRYFILNFLCSQDLLDKQKTKFVDDFVIKPVFDTEKLIGLSIFGVPGDDGPRTYCSQSMRDTIKGISPTGLEARNFANK